MEIFRSALQFYARREMQSIFVIKYINTLATLSRKVVAVLYNRWDSHVGC